MDFIFEQICTGGDRNYGYLIGDRNAGVCALVDPSYQAALLVERARLQKMKVKYIFNTHGHSDHTNGNSEAKDLTGAEIAIYQNSSVPHDRDLTDGQTLDLGSIKIEVIYTPGHSSDHVVFYLPEYQIALTGDHLFVGKIGGTSSEETSKQQYESFQRLLTILPEETTIWPGHNYGCRPSSTWLLELKCNPFLIQKNFTAFCEIKHNWSHFKKENGLL